MRLILAGGTGFVGSALHETLTRNDHEVLILTRQAFKENAPGTRTRYLHWNPPNPGKWEQEFEGVDGMINLAGEPIIGKRWSPQQKRKVIESRISATRAIVEAIRKSKRRPQVLINASAVGYYGPHGDEEVTEDSPVGNDFLARTCQEWEAEAMKAESLGVRVVRIRIGIVLEKKGGALAKMLPPFQLGLGGPLGSGRQWMSWIHLDDLTELIGFALEKKTVQGPLNATAPAPVTMKEFSRSLGKALHRPAFFPVPETLVKILLGEMSDVLLKGQRVMPKKSLKEGFIFRFPKLDNAFKDIFEK